jgi:hypothetical protein
MLFVSMTGYLIRKSGAKVAAHIWLGDDTACRMFSTGGLKKDRFAVFETQMGRPLCVMCRNVSERSKPVTSEEQPIEQREQPVEHADRWPPNDDVVWPWPINCSKCGNEAVVHMSAAQIRGKVLRCRCGYAPPPWE